VAKRLQVLLDEAELRELRRVAKAQRMTVAEWVRQALRAARLRQPLGDAPTKIAAVRVAARHTFPTGSLEDMLADIEHGYLDTSSR
jgi:hypothetical protein